MLVGLLSLLGLDQLQFQLDGSLNSLDAVQVLGGSGVRRSGNGKRGRGRGVVPVVGVEGGGLERRMVGIVVGKLSYR